MGGNNTTLNEAMGGNEFPERVRPLLQRKLEEFKKRSRNRNRNSNGNGGDPPISKVVPLPSSEREEKVLEGLKIDQMTGNGEDEEAEFGRHIGLGSPSFRIYYIQSDNNKDDEQQHGHRETDEEENVPIMHHHKTRSCDSAESAASGNSCEPVEFEPTIPKKKANRRKKFTAMRKNLLNLQLRQKLNPMFSCAGGGSGRKRLPNSQN